MAYKFDPNEKPVTVPHPDSITLTLDDDSQILCDVLEIYTIQGKNYIFIMPSAEEDEDEEYGNVYTYLFELDENENPILTEITDDDEYEMVTSYFDTFYEEPWDESEDEN